ncbi:LysR family transcriptional regulator [Variovorax sp. RA8]|uniref:LysR family transcriptional regulator n=1 Tax=Variovorax sp. (strain JCM 16519 / RA8) TaxID=662548 RepID=UPI001316C52F|nr:LysR family transcriptional regulator [Variovorax sp. RA8]VTU25449.1 HTH-type transcriptional activator AmpR [Variovorax sp. RA8]
MARTHLPLNALRAFESSARHLSFTLAAAELNVTQAAVSQQVRGLEARLGVALFRRLPRGLALSDEGHALLPVLAESFGRMEAVVQQFDNGHFFEVLTVGVVGTFAVGWLLPRLRLFQQSCPFVDLRLMTHNNVVDLAGEGLDCAIRFGDGNWPGLKAEHLMAAPLSVLCAPAIAARIAKPRDLAPQTLLRSYRSEDWPAWFAAAGAACPAIRGPVFDSSRLMVEAAMQGAGVALAPASMFERELDESRLVRPLSTEVTTGSYWLVRLKSRKPSAAMEAFRRWLADYCSTRHSHAVRAAGLHSARAGG